MRLQSTFRKRRSNFSVGTSCRSEHFDTRDSSEIDYASYRENSERLRQLRNYYFTRATHAYSKGQGNLARRMSQQGWLVHSALQHANKQSVKDIVDLSNYEYKISNYNSTHRTLNLHGLRVNEALDVVQEFLAETDGYKGRLRIITGWGSNSYPRQPQLLPAMKELLSQQGRCYHEIRPGVIEIMCNV